MVAAGFTVVVVAGAGGTVALAVGTTAPESGALILSNTTPCDSTFAA